ncbi:MAG: M23 family peptidase, partial [Flavobacterium sp.]|nr:M23 family peptidase [Flavobacterium sp.]
VATVGAILIIFVTTYIIAFTPLREYIPGYASSKLKQEALEMAIKSDSLEKSVKINNAYIASIKKSAYGRFRICKIE